MSHAEPLTEVYRPRTLSDLVGQGYATLQLQAFADQPHTTGFLFAGGTGTGKTSAAQALARDLGVLIEDAEWGGWYFVKSGEQTADIVRETLSKIRTGSFGIGSGWRVVLVDEADHCSTAVKALWLSAIEHLPPRTVVIFTTNNPAAFDTRARSRFELVEFDADPAINMQDAQVLALRVWEGETGSADGCPDMRDARDSIIDPDTGKISYRMVVQFLAPRIRMLPKSSRVEPAQPARPDRRDLLGAALPPHRADSPSASTQDSKNPSTSATNKNLVVAGSYALSAGPTPSECRTATLFGPDFASVPTARERPVMRETMLASSDDRYCRLPAGPLFAGSGPPKVAGNRKARLRARAKA